MTTLAYAWISDTILNGSRWPPVIFGAVSITLRKKIERSSNILPVRQHHKLRLTCSLGHSDWMEMDLLHYQRGWIRIEWSVNGVSFTRSRGYQRADILTKLPQMGA